MQSIIYIIRKNVNHKNQAIKNNLILNKEKNHHFIHLI